MRTTNKKHAIIYNVKTDKYHARTVDVEKFANNSDFESNTFHYYAKLTYYQSAYLLVYIFNNATTRNNCLIDWETE
jgi:hypothetical protein